MQKFRDVLSWWESGRLCQMEAAALLGCSERQFRRYRDRFAEEGEAGLVDRRLGRPSAKAIAAADREAMLALYRARHRGWTAKHFHDHGRRHHGFSWGYTWTKTQLHGAGLLDRSPRRGAHRRKRERMPCEGMMLHQDGSRHAWLAGEPPLDLIVTMDDASSTIYSAFLVEEEGTMSTLRACLEVFGEHGLPSSMYTDRGSHYFTTPEAGGKVDKVHLTQVGRAFSRLGIEHKPAYSPEARGRSERMFGTLQDRLVKELALAGIRDVESANRWIKETFLPEHNRLFSRPAAVPDKAYVAVARETLVEIPASPMRAHDVKAHVKVRQYPNGSVAIFHGPRPIARFDACGEPVIHVPPTTRRPDVPAAPSVAACSAASRRGLASEARVDGPERRPALTRPVRSAKRLPCRKGSRCAAQASPS